MVNPNALFRSAASLGSGAMLGLGLLISGMADPSKVLAFLDLWGPWNPSLALVMAAAVAVGGVGLAMAARRDRSLLGLPMNLPQRRALDRRLLAGATMFGVGWGLAGFCPGPAIVAAASGVTKALLFSAALLVGMVLYELTQRAPR